MTDPPLDPLDELASARLDGEAPADTADRIEGDRDVADRVVTFDAVRRAIRSAPDAAPAAAREAAIEAALAAFDADPTASLPGRRHQRTGRRVVAIGARRAPMPSWARAVGAAAAAVLLAALVPALLDDDGGDDGAVTAAEDTRRQEEDGAARAGGPGGAEADTSVEAPAPAAGAGGAAGGGGGSADAEALTATTAIPHLGDHAELDTLADAVRRQLAGPIEPSPATTPPSPAVAACLARATDAALARSGTVVLMAIATFAGRSATVVVTEGPDGARTLAVLDEAARCTLVAEQLL